MSAILRKISPSLGSLSDVNRSSYHKYPELQMVMLQHTRSSPYLVQFFKQPLQAPCACVICRDGLWSPFKLTAELAADLPHSWQVPLPIPIPVEAGQPMHYIMSLHEAMQHTFTEEHQPSLIDKNESRTKRRARPAQTACQHHPVLKIFVAKTAPTR